MKIKIIILSVVLTLLAGCGPSFGELLHSEIGQSELIFIVSYRDGRYTISEIIRDSQGSLKMDDAVDVHLLRPGKNPPERVLIARDLSSSAPQGYLQAEYPIDALERVAGSKLTLESVRQDFSKR